MTLTGGDYLRVLLSPAFVRPLPFTGSVTDRDAVDIQIAAWQVVLRLADWHIRSTGIEPDADCRSNVSINVLVKGAVLRFRSDTPMSQVDRQIVHELLHVLMSGMEDAFIAAKDHTPKVWDAIGDRMWTRGEEYAIEALVDALVGIPRSEWTPGDEEWNAGFPVDAQEVQG